MSYPNSHAHEKLSLLLSAHTHPGKWRQRRASYLSDAGDNGKGTEEGVDEGRVDEDIEVVEADVEGTVVEAGVEGTVV